MLHATLQQLRGRFPGARFDLLSIYPMADRHCNRENDLEIISAAPLKLLAWYMPLALLGKLGLSMRLFLSTRITFFRSIQAADAVIDLSGIAFVDGRGLPLLWYNLSSALPGIIWGKPVFKLSQALGPFKSTVNRMLAKPLLQHCAVVVARGDQTRKFLIELGLQESISLPDVSFALTIPEATLCEAAHVLRNLDGSGAKWVVISPSKVVANLCSHYGIDFLKQMKQFVEHLLKEGVGNILILPHSLGGGGSKNNDINLCEELYRSLSDKQHVFLHIPIEDPLLLRAIIGRATFFVGCRFHAVVAALITGVPSLILGWSHKYIEMAAVFNADIPSIDFSAFSADALIEAFQNAWQMRELTHARLQASGPIVKALAITNFDLIEMHMRQ
jgi:polysaccharide pyruvyl transferase WcaK-like protein